MLFDAQHRDPRGAGHRERRHRSGAGSPGAGRPSDEHTDEVVLDAMCLALVATRVTVAWHAGALSADQALEELAEAVDSLHPAVPARS